MKTKARKITQAVRKYVERITAPEGWTREVYEGKWLSSPEKWAAHDDPGTVTVALYSPAVQLFFRVSMMECWRRGKKGRPVVSYSGTTRFLARGSWLSFDRTGVSDSFNSNYGEPAGSPAAEIAAQTARVADYLQKDAARLDVPGTGYRISPEAREEYSRKLKAGQSVVFTPSGFGTGRRYTTRRPRHPYATKAPRELADFFGVPELWCETFDCD